MKRSLARPRMWREVVGSTGRARQHPDVQPLRRRTPGVWKLVALGLPAMLVVGACSPGGRVPASASPTSTMAPSPASSGSESGPVGSSMIPQPSMEALNQRTRRRLAPESRRIDLVAPTFSDPTRITNPLFPIGELTSALLLGRLHGRPWRAETTLLPDTKTIAWNGQQIETLQSQFVAYLDGRIFEIAVDLYAQADDGSVWYFGEDAFTYGDGRVVDTEGTWVAGVDGPPAMIMPGDPKIGDVYRTENIPGLVFEQVTVQAVGVTVDGPTGPVAGAMVAQELHMDEVRLEDKFFAPGYGEFFSGGGRTFEATALAIPADALSEPVPAELEALSTGALDIADAAGSSDWSAASAAVDSTTTAWQRFEAGGTPPLLATQMTDALETVAGAVSRRGGSATVQAALDVGRAALDLQLRYRPPVEVNLARFDLWTRQLEADAASGDLGSAVGDVATLGWIRDRIALDPSEARSVDDALRFLGAAVEAGELRAAAAAAARLRGTVAGLASA
jgi:hypothetical protein